LPTGLLTKIAGEPGALGRGPRKERDRSNNTRSKKGTTALKTWGPRLAAVKGKESRLTFGKKKDERAKKREGRTIQQKDNQLKGMGRQELPFRRKKKKKKRLDLIAFSLQTNLKTTETNGPRGGVHKLIQKRYAQGGGGDYPRAGKRKSQSESRRNREAEGFLIDLSTAGLARRGGRGQEGTSGGSGGKERRAGAR